MIEAANTRPHCVPLGPCISAMAMGRVWFSGVVIEVSAPDQLTLDARVAEAMPVIHSFEFIR